MNCEQNCEVEADVLIYDDAENMFMLLCDTHENEIARIEGEDELKEIDLRYSTPQQISEFMNKIIREKDLRYHELLTDFLNLRDGKKSS